MTVDANTERLHAIRPLTGADGHAAVKHEQRACKKRAGRAGGWGLGLVRIREAHERGGLQVVHTQSGMLTDTILDTIWPLMQLCFQFWCSPFQWSSPLVCM